jgi:sulfide dehydrogenase cytochrome subunit
MAPRWALLLVLAVPAHAQEAPPGASACFGCHSPTRANAAIPSLRGRDPAEVAAMLRLARGFNEAESRAIAEWVVR